MGNHSPHDGQRERIPLRPPTRSRSRHIHNLNLIFPNKSHDRIGCAAHRYLHRIQNDERPLLVDTHIARELRATRERLIKENRGSIASLHILENPWPITSFCHQTHWISLRYGPILCLTIRRTPTTTRELRCKCSIQRGAIHSALPSRYDLHESQLNLPDGSPAPAPVEDMASNLTYLRTDRDRLRDPHGPRSLRQSHRRTRCWYFLYSSPNFEVNTRSSGMI
jgi:hypothetical protein